MPYKNNRELVAADVEKLVRKYGTRDPFKLADYLNLKIRRRSLPEGIAGLVGELWGKVMIVLDLELPEDEARYIVAHEIYHHLDKHPDIVLTKKALWGDWFEVKADLFAASLLICEKPRWSETEIEFAARTQVPVRLVRLWFRRAA
jgi:hypothetical protein